MRNRDIYTIQNNISQLSDVKDDLTEAVTKFLNDLNVIEKELSKEFGASHILSKTRTTLESIDVDELFDFVDDLEAETATLYYKSKRAESAIQIATYPKKNTPAFYKPNTLDMRK